MSNISANLRKAAVLIRSLDGETAAKLLAQLSAEEAAAIREAIRELGSIDEVEQADVAAELRRGKTAANRIEDAGVELRLSSQDFGNLDSALKTKPTRGQRFEFLEHSPIEIIAAHLACEHSQTIAVVLSQLQPARAVSVLGALPAKLQAETVERLSRLGESDPESLTAVETELAAWAARHPAARRSMAPISDAVKSILAAADNPTRARILSNVQRHNQRLAAQFQPAANSPSARHRTNEPPRLPSIPARLNRRPISAHVRAAVSVAFKFDDLVRLADTQLVALLDDVNPQLLVLAMVGSSDELVDRIARHMPKRQAKAFRRQLRHVGPTRLSDVEAAQQAVADAAGRLAARQRQQNAAAA